MSQCKTLEASEYSRRDTPSNMLWLTSSATRAHAYPAQSGPYSGTGPNRSGDQVIDPASALAIWAFVSDRTPCTPHQLFIVQTRASRLSRPGPQAVAEHPVLRPRDRRHRAARRPAGPPGAAPGSLAARGAAGRGGTGRRRPGDVRPRPLVLQRHAESAESRPAATSLHY